MPLYDYSCRACGHQFEALVRAADVVACPSCQSEDVERLISSFGVSSGQLSNAAKRDVRKQGEKTRRDRVEYEREIARKHHDH
jgi:putative FmdB family regulatory protein